MMFIKRSIIILVIFLSCSIFFSCISYYPPMFTAVDDVYVAPPEIGEGDNVSLNLDADLEADYMKNSGFFTAGFMNFLTIQAAVTAGVSLRTSDNSLINFDLTSGVAGGIADKIVDGGGNFELFNEGALTSVGVFAQADIMYLFAAKEISCVPGISYTASYEALGEYLEYRRINSELDLGVFEQISSQFLFYCEFSTDIIAEKSGSLFIRPFIGYSNIASFDPFSVPNALREYIRVSDYEIDSIGYSYMYNPDFGTYIGYRDGCSYYFKVRVSEMMNFSCSIGFES